MGKPQVIEFPSRQVEFDAAALGAMMHRFDSGEEHFQWAPVLRRIISGAEANPILNMSNLFRRRTAICTATLDDPDHPIAGYVDRQIRAMGAVPIYAVFPADKYRMGCLFSDRPRGRTPTVTYDRDGEAAQSLRPESFDLEDLFGRRGVSIAHTGGLFCALSANTADTALAFLKSAAGHGVVTSFDINFRPKLWKKRGGDGAAREFYKKMLAHTAICVGNEEDLEKAVGIESRVPAENLLDPAVRAAIADDFAAAAERLAAMFPNIKVVARTLRCVVSPVRHEWSAIAWAGGQTAMAPSTELDVLDRVGGGDGFAAGFLHSLLQGKSLEESVMTGWRVGGLVAGTYGDTAQFSAGDIDRFPPGRIAR